MLSKYGRISSKWKSILSSFQSIFSTCKSALSNYKKKGSFNVHSILSKYKMIHSKHIEKHICEAQQVYLQRMEAASFITSLARTKTRDTPAPLRHAATTSIISRRTAFLTHAAMTAFAASLLFEDPTHHHNLDGEPPSLSDLLTQLCTSGDFPSCWSL